MQSLKQSHKPGQIAKIARWSGVLAAGLMASACATTTVQLPPSGLNAAACMQTQTTTDGRRGQSTQTFSNDCATGTIAMEMSRSDDPALQAMGIAILADTDPAIQQLLTQYRDGNPQVVASAQQIASLMASNNADPVMQNMSRRIGAQLYVGAAPEKQQQVFNILQQGGQDATALIAQATAANPAPCRMVTVTGPNGPIGRFVCQ